MASANASAVAALSMSVHPTCDDCWVLPDHSTYVTAIAPPTLPSMAFCTAALWKASM